MGSQRNTKPAFIVKLVTSKIWTFSPKKAILETVNKSGTQSNQQYNLDLLECVMKKDLPEGGARKAFRGFLYPLGGFCIWGGDL
ncbi:MAG: hypothetical protein JSW56_19500 [Deltaproteobacteria bacterium]|nr:MAG: hypothetical protein JSW56_19500 [Deltaproteobacteria bacterium]